MDIEGIDHVGIVTGNLAESATFFSNNLGFAQGVVEEARELKLKMVLLTRGADTIELLEPDTKEGATFGLRHIAFRCRDIDRLIEELREKNIKLLHQTPQQYENKRFFFCKGTDGVLLEFIEEPEELM